MLNAPSRLSFEFLREEGVSCDYLVHHLSAGDEKASKHLYVFTANPYGTLVPAIAATLFSLRFCTPLKGSDIRGSIPRPSLSSFCDDRLDNVWYKQVLPALPEKGIHSTVDGGDPKPLSPLDTLEAHQKGAAVMAESPDGRFMATGGADGLVCLWMVYENQVCRWTAAKSENVLCTLVTQLRFFVLTGVPLTCVFLCGT